MSDNSKIQLEPTCTPGLFRVVGQLEITRHPSEHMRPMGSKFYYVAERPVRCCHFSEYWYYWGDQVFDIRELRKAARIKLSWAFDGDYCKTDKAAVQLANISQKHDLVSLLKPLLFDIKFGDFGFVLTDPVEYMAYRFDNVKEFQFLMSVLDEIGLVCCDRTKPLDLSYDSHFRYLIINSDTFQFWSVETKLIGYKEVGFSRIQLLPKYLELKKAGIAKLALGDM